MLTHVRTVCEKHTATKNHSRRGVMHNKDGRACRSERGQATRVRQDHLHRAQDAVDDAKDKQKPAVNDDRDDAAPW
eukprot:390013-Pleurochrysis_carterae.AAC.1